jgi:hypothetical protein
MTTLEKRAAATLRIHSITLSSDEISAILRTQPTQSFSKGERMSPRNPSSAIFEENLWLLESGEDSSMPLDIHILRLVDFIEHRLPAIKQLMSDCEIDIFCGYFSANGQGGLTLTADVMRSLGAIPIDLIVDISC